MNNSQEMLHKEQPQQQQPQPQQDDLKFSNSFNQLILNLADRGGGGGGGKGKPFVSYQGSTTSISTICRNDPNNPGQQICKRVERHSYLDPNTGRQTTKTHESEDFQPSSGGVFSGFKGQGLQLPPSNLEQSHRNFDGDKKNSISDRLKQFFGWNADEPQNQYQQQAFNNQQESYKAVPPPHPFYKQNQFQLFQSGNQNFGGVDGGFPINQPQQFSGSFFSGDQGDDIFDSFMMGAVDPFRILEENERKIRKIFGEDFPIYDKNSGRQGANDDFFRQFEQEFFGNRGNYDYNPAERDFNQFQQRRLNNQQPQQQQHMNQQNQPINPEFEVKQSINPVHGLKLTGKIYDV